MWFQLRALWDPFAVVVHDSDVQLRGVMPLVGGEAQPAHCCHAVSLPVAKN
jgi:hypothetical protein